MDQPNSPSLLVKSILCAAAWVVAIIAICLVAGEISPVLLMSPIFTVPGILVLMLTGEPVSPAIAGWIYYILLTVFVIGAKRIRTFGWLFGILCVSLLLNIAGCESAKHADYHM